jgi:hypothetical protein
MFVDWDQQWDYDVNGNVLVATLEISATLLSMQRLGIRRMLIFG